MQLGHFDENNFLIDFKTPIIHHPKKPFSLKQYPFA